MSEVRDPRFAYDSNGKQLGLNWAAILPERPESEQPSVRATLPPLTKKKKRGPVSAASLANLTHVPDRRFDYQKIADLWSAGKTNVQIRKIMGCGQTTILLALKEIQPEGYTGTPGPRRQDRCKRDHDLNEHGRPRKKGGRDCMACKREANARETERRRAAKAAS